MQEKPKKRGEVKIALPKTLSFDPKLHKYTINGGPADGVTTIIGGLMKVKYGDLSFFVNRYNGMVFESEVIEKAGDYGTALHSCCAEIAAGRDINLSKLPSKLSLPLEGYKPFLRDQGIQPLLLEQIVADEDSMVCGTIDMVARWCDRVWIFDIKTGSIDPKIVDLQLAGYEWLLRTCSGYRGRIGRAVITPPGKDGKGRWKIKATGSGQKSIRLFKNLIEIHKELKS